ncbi:MAG: VWA domain-containing protein [Gammaproteobacteria bacterium]|nr:VWA domain-containing protein [Gammaproteobacteria bacterium]
MNAQFSVVLCLVLMVTVFDSHAINNKPLLMEGKKNLYQRILTLPDAALYPGQTPSTSNPIQLPPFSAYYVYSRKQDSDKHLWLQIGLDRSGHVVGWVDSTKTMEWSHGLTLSFRNPTPDTGRALLFRDKESLKNIAQSHNKKRYKKIYKAASTGSVMKDSPVVAIQPLHNIDIRKNFYLLPIQDYEEIYLNYSTARLLKVSSISLKNSRTETSQANKSKRTSALAHPANIVFAIDSTLSMGPYIQRTQQAVSKVLNALKQQSLIGAVQFGLIAFRDNVSAAPSIDYLARQFVSLEQGKNSNTFLSAVDSLKPANYSSQDFVEDSYAGILLALKEMDWSPNADRFVILITDAGARDFNDPLGSTGLSASELNKLAQNSNTAIFVLHLRTSDPMADHENAARQYRELSKFQSVGNLYYAVPTGNLQEFGTVLDSLSSQITNQITKSTVIAEPDSEASANKQLAELKAKVKKLGHALQIRYLKNSLSEPVPDLIDAWLLDKSFNNPEKSVVDVRVLLTRDQLSDLYTVLKQVLETAEQGLISPNTFLSELKSLAATIARDPEQLGGTTALTAGQGNSLAEMGFVREYIEDLPYTGEVMNLSLQDWQTWSVAEQTEFIRRLEEKITYYQALHDHVDLWVSLSGGPLNGDSVFPVPLDMLP